MKIENLERAGQIHEQLTALNNALKAVEKLRTGDEEGDVIIENQSDLELHEINAQYSLELKGCKVGAEIIAAIEGVLGDKLQEIIGEARKL